MLRLQPLCGKYIIALIWFIVFRLPSCLSSFRLSSSGVALHREGDGKADSEPVFDEFADLVNQSSMSVSHRGERQHDQVHEAIHEGSIN
jgi:hypothetical protein